MVTRVPAPFFQFNLQIAAMEAGQGMGNGQAKARALMALVEARIDLTKGAHGGFNFRQRHSHAGVADGDGDDSVLPGADVNANAALGGSEFHGVAEKVDEDLLEPERIGHQIGKVRHDVGFNLHVFLAGLRFNDQEAGLEDGGDADGFQIDGEFAGLNLRDIENAVDQGEEMFGGLADIGGVLFDFFRARYGLGGEHVGKADDGVQGRAQFVAHVGDELGLGLGGQFSIDLGGVECGGLLLTGDSMAKMLGIFTDQRTVLEPAISKCTHKTPAPMRLASRHSLN